MSILSRKKAKVQQSRSRNQIIIGPGEKRNLSSEAQKTIEAGQKKKTVSLASNDKNRESKSRKKEGNFQERRSIRDRGRESYEKSQGTKRTRSLYPGTDLERRRVSLKSRSEGEQWRSRGDGIQPIEASTISTQIKIFE